AYLWGHMSLRLRHHSRGIVQQDNANYEVGAGDADSSCSSGQFTSSRSSKGYSSRTGSREDSQGSSTQSDYKEEADTTANRTLSLSPTYSHVSITLWCKKKTNTLSRNHKASRFPPIKPLQGSNQRTSSAHRHRIKELNSQVWELQQQLSGVATENKLLKQLQGRHAVIKFCTHPHRQVLAKHGNAMRALQELQRKARNRRNCLSRRLRGTKEELLRTKDALYRLQLLSEDCSLEEREELSHRLALITVDLHRKNKRIQDLERNLELSQISFNQPLATETRKTNEARELSDYLQAQINLNYPIYPQTMECCMVIMTRRTHNFRVRSIALQRRQRVPSRLQKECKQPFESQVRYTLDDFLNTERANMALKSPPRTKHLYTFKETIQNLHSGKPAYARHSQSLTKSPPKYIKSQARVENLGSRAYEPSFTLPAEKCQRRDTMDPQPEDGVVRSKKSILMKELFGQQFVKYTRLPKVYGHPLVKHPIPESWALIWSWTPICCYNSLHSSGKAFH
uniref:Lebercilin-like protein n=1 Tax=Oncorhynchus kisutch TaxID=8019 RepID=A0A8C7I6A8_ONCKI